MTKYHTKAEAAPRLQGFVSGKPTGEFGVENPVTYAEVLKMALVAAGHAPDAAAGLLRNRAAQNTWSAAYVEQAEAMRLSLFTAGLDVHTPAPGGAVVQILLEAIGIIGTSTPATYSDVPPGHPHAHAIAVATFLGLVEGDTASDGSPLGTFRPDDQINRADVAKTIALAREMMKE